MNAIKGTWHSGQIILEEPADWPEGTELIIEPASPELTFGVCEEDWPTDPAGITAHLALMDQIEPLDMTPDEEAAWRAARKAQKDYDTTNLDQRTRQIERAVQ